MTPDELRELASKLRMVFAGNNPYSDGMDAAADAWEKDVHSMWEVNAAQRARIEELDRVIEYWKRQAEALRSVPAGKEKS